MSEKEIEKEILQWLDHHSRVVRVWKNDQDRIGMRKFARHNKKKGLPDIGGFLDDGRFLAVEVKAPGNKASPEQEAFLLDAKNAGCVAILAYSLHDVCVAMTNL